VKIASTALQLFGLALSLFGVAVVRAWLERATDAAIEAKRGAARWWALRRTQLQHWWARRRGRPVTVNLTAAEMGLGTDSLSIVVTRAQVDRATISDRDWLAQLDDHIESLFKRLDDSAAARRADREGWDRQLEAQRNEMRDEILKATRQGWQLIVTGIGFTAVGTVLQFWT
jgi:hypothetical protein